jgi:precorrin isomerase
MASSHSVEPVKNGTALATTKATLRAQAYNAIVRALPVSFMTAAREKPRLTTALSPVTNAQTMKGANIRFHGL